MLQKAAIEKNVGCLYRKSIFKIIMRRLACEGDEVLRSVVVFDFIEMVNWLPCSLQKSMQERFDDKPMLLDVSPNTATGMLRGRNANVSLALMPNTASPRMVIWPKIFSELSLPHFLSTFFRATLPKIKMRWASWVSLHKCFAPFSDAFRRMFASPLRMIFFIFESFLLRQAHFFLGFRCLLRTFDHVFSPHHIIQIINGDVNYMFRMIKA